MYFSELGDENQIPREIVDGNRIPINLLGDGNQIPREVVANSNRFLSMGIEFPSIELDFQQCYRWEFNFHR